MKEIVAVIAISVKKERGWIKCATAFKSSWQDLGMSFDKGKFANIFVAPGLYEIEFENSAGFGSPASYTVSNAKKIGTFSELVDSTGLVK